MRFVSLVGVLSLSCKSPTAAEQLEDVQSWLATADMTAQAWLNHTTPENYTRQTLELTGENVHKTAAELMKYPPATVDSGSLDSLLTGSRDRIARMDTLVHNRDAPRVRLELDSLRHEERTVRDISERLKSTK